MLATLILIHFGSIDFDEIAKRINQVDTYTELIALINDDLGYNGLESIIDRELGNNTQQTRLKFTTQEYGKYYHLSLVKKEDKLLYCVLSNYKKQHEIVFDESGIIEYLDYFNSIFKTSKSLQDFKLEIDCIVLFSDGCGFSGEPTKDWIKMEKFVQNKKVKGIRNYLNSLDVESQIYGIIGMYKLRKKGVKLSAKDQQTIDYLIERNSKVYTCMGCLIGEVFDTKDLVKYYEH